MGRSGDLHLQLKQRQGGPTVTIVLHICHMSFVIAGENLSRHSSASHLNPKIPKFHFFTVNNMVLP